MAHRPNSRMPGLKLLVDGRAETRGVLVDFLG
jgi:hypothetical protein